MQLTDLFPKFQHALPFAHDADTHCLKKGQLGRIPASCWCKMTSDDYLLITLRSCLFAGSSRGETRRSFWYVERREISRHMLDQLFVFFDFDFAAAIFICFILRQVSIISPSCKALQDAACKKMTTAALGRDRNGNSPWFWVTMADAQFSAKPKPKFQCTKCAMYSYCIHSIR